MQDVLHVLGLKIGEVLIGINAQQLCESNAVLVYVLLASYFVQ